MSYKKGEMSQYKKLKEFLRMQGKNSRFYIISGCSSNNAMKLLDKIGSFLVEILVDSQSTHNFLNPLVVEAAKLRIVKDSRLQAKVANGDKILSQRRCEEAIRIQGTKFLIPFHALTLGVCEIVLGLWWLKTLGPIN